MDGPAAGHSPHDHCAVELDIEREVNHTRFGPKSFKDCRKMGNNVIFEFVSNHTSRMAPSGAVLEAYMTLKDRDKRRRRGQIANRDRALGKREDVDRSQDQD